MQIEAACPQLFAVAQVEDVHLYGREIRGSAASVIEVPPVHQRNAPPQALGEAAAAIAVDVVEVGEPEDVTIFVT